MTARKTAAAAQLAADAANDGATVAAEPQHDAETAADLTARTGLVPLAELTGEALIDAAAGIDPEQLDAEPTGETDEQRDERHAAKAVRDADDAAQRADETKTTETARRRRDRRAPRGTAARRAQDEIAAEPANALDAIGDGPGNKRDRERFAALADDDARVAIRVRAAALYDGSRTVARCWKDALDEQHAIADAERADAAKTGEPTAVAVTVFVGADGNFKIHKPGCRDIAKALADPHVDADSAHDTAYVSVEQAVRDLWSDQIGDNWDYAQGEPSLEYLADHSFVGTVDVLPCIARKLTALPQIGDAEPTPRRTRAPRAPKAEPKFRADLGTLDSIAGYVVVKSTPGFDQLKRSDLGGDPSRNVLGDAAPDAPAADRPEWLTRCNVHGKTTTAPDRKAGRALGAIGARAGWCSGCKRAAKSDATEPTATEPTATEPTATEPTATEPTGDAAAE
jgi:hypothetical protein